MKNKNLIIAAVVAVLIALVGGYFVLFSKKAPSVNLQTSTQSQTQDQAQQTAVPTIAAEDIGLTMTATFNNKKILIGITKTTGLSLIDYQLAYVSKGNVPRGVIGQIQVISGKPVSQEIVLGTCSDVCHYDEGVSSVKLTLKVTKTDGNTYQLEKTLNF